MSGDLPTEMMIGAQRRIAAREGVPVIVTRRGADAGGAMLLKIDRLDGTARVLSQARFEGELVWNPVSRSDPMDEKAAEAYLARQAAIDPDLWIVEIEDRQGRHWFPGKVMA